jgi:hypothetical protein
MFVYLHFLIYATDHSAEEPTTDPKPYFAYLQFENGVFI